MRVLSTTLHVTTEGFNDVHDLTPAVKGFLAASGLKAGVLTVFVPGSTAGITTIEYEPGAVRDLQKAIDRIIPGDIHYDHDARWGDDNGFSHLRASLFGPSLSIPIVGGQPYLGTWQQVVLLDFDNRPRTREIIVQLIGESE